VEASEAKVDAAVDVVAVAAATITATQKWRLMDPAMVDEKKRVYTHSTLSVA
jgi:hypothetical protein